ncbi:hypothetical protein CPHO_06030 [Corynebacterium phocae]|uniref:Uncharacterized protein n=1 Tax=Corynebacterium phocae TaxID=161895 RepID=A0A1L7D3D8_9CORY|nr:hypothetical protein [Corynebacterium phocae]APT92521.1 hypothetical protein CPHO_06030 [Corynebacterium phocae]KAA8725124.1 hypothetical protein F4V58_05570 [Corynebacterium phocae]
MSIRADFQPTVDEFISNLESFSTGDYLKPEEKEFWDQPFDPKVLPELRKILERMLDGFDQVPADPDGETLAKAVQRHINELEKFNAKNADAVIEPEEKEELNLLIHDAAAATGADEEALNSLPEFE